MSDPLATVDLRRTPQSQRADKRQSRNNAGGFTFTVDTMTRLNRFLTLGTDGGTYYSSAVDLTRDNAKVVIEVAQTDCVALVDAVVAVSTAGRAPRQNPALFALVVAASLGDDAGRARALAALPAVARTGTHLFLFARYVEQFRGWGRGLRRAVGNWYLGRDVGALEYQLLKYRQREGWSHRDLLRLAHPVTDEPARRALFDLVCGRELADLAELPLYRAFLAAQRSTDPGTWVRLIEESALSWEMLPDAALTEPAVWAALVDRGMPQTALLRQLPRLTRLHVVGRGIPRTRAVAEQLADPERCAPRGCTR